MGAQGILALAALSGIVDVDALTLSVARLAGTQFTLTEAANAILVACGVNTLAKAAIAGCSGGWRLGLLVAVPSVAAVLAMAIARFSGS